MMRFLSLASAAAGLSFLALGSPVDAAVRYDFKAYPPGAGGLTGIKYSGTFSYIADDFIRSYQVAPEASLSACSVVSTSSSATCRDQYFWTEYRDTYNADVIYFSIRDPDFAGSLYYYFPRDSFSQSGIYETVFGSPGQLTVTDLGARAAVPEPATWAMMLAGFGMIGFAARRRSAVKTTVKYA